MELRQANELVVRAYQGRRQKMNNDERKRLSGPEWPSSLGVAETVVDSQIELPHTALRVIENNNGK